MELQFLTIPNWRLQNGTSRNNVGLSYQTFGPALGTAPVVVVNHALTGNSHVTGKKGWWANLIGKGQIIDTTVFTVIAFNIPGNGYDGAPENLIDDYKEYTTGDVAGVFWQGLDLLGVEKLFSVIGGSLGGGVAWEMAALRPGAIENLIPVATDWKATDWVIANVLVQERILNNSTDPIANARLHAMLLYRTPQSLQQRFKRQRAEGNAFKIETWLNRHGHKLQERFTLQAYRLMNHLLGSIDITRNGGFETVLSGFKGSVHLIAVDTDMLFTADETLDTYKKLQDAAVDVVYNEIKSIHGHDAFLMEYEQLADILAPVFKTRAEKAELSKAVKK
ncbi:alpha/beta fold hydrolase [Flavobacterium rhizosphaerae]|uniref:Alpha/beta fold hydrolase n=1 Tax=Flavobacterium rhizosphaerae TaxID=3163298 RepID=A0ABW8YUG5_9FLAO